MKKTTAQALIVAVITFVVVAFIVSLFEQPASIKNCITDVKTNYTHITDPEAQCNHLRSLNPSMFDNLYKEPRP